MIVRTPSAVELGNVGHAMHLLHVVDGGGPLGPAATVQRAYAFLTAMQQSGRGSVLVAVDDIGYAGCVVLQYDMIPYAGCMLVGGLSTVPKPPRNTVLHLMQAVIEEAQKRDVTDLYLFASTEKNKTRRTYARLGFRDTGKRMNGSFLYHAFIEDAKRGLSQITRSAALAAERKQI